MTNYLQQIKEISDSLTDVEAFVIDRNLIVATLVGLPNEFESIVDSTMLRLSSTSMDELHGLLLTKELSMSRRKKATPIATKSFWAFSVNSQPSLLPTSSPQQAFAAQHQPFHNSYWFNSNRGRHGNRFHHNCGNRGNYQGNHTNQSNRRKFQGHRSSSSSGQRVPCQIYGSTSREAIDCFDRMNPDISGCIPPAKLQAMYAHYGSKPSPSWLIDSGATSHITNDISNINSPMPYTREDQVYIGDGKMLSQGQIKDGLFPLQSPSSPAATPFSAFIVSKLLSDFGTID